MSHATRRPYHALVGVSSRIKRHTLRDVYYGLLTVVCVASYKGHGHATHAQSGAEEGSWTSAEYMQAVFKDNMASPEETWTPNLPLSAIVTSPAWTDTSRSRKAEVRA